MNRVTLIGNLGRDPEVKKLPSGLTVANLRVATNEKTKDGTESVEWHNVTLFGPLAEGARELKVGNRLHVEGKIKTDTYEKNGETRYSTKIIGNYCGVYTSLYKGDNAPARGRPAGGVSYGHTTNIDDATIPF